MSEKFPGFKQREDMIQFAADIRAETMKILHEERDKDRALLERMVNHLTVPPRSTWRVVQLAGDDTPHDVSIEFPAQVVYVDNGSTATVQVRAPGDIAQSPPITTQGAWLIPGATQVTVTGTGTGQVRLRFLNEAAARLLYSGGAPGASTTAPLYAELTGSLALLPNTKIDLVGSYDITTRTLTPGTTVVAAGAQYNSALQNLTGYRTVIPAAIVSGTSPDWTLQAVQTIPNYGNLTSEQTTGITGIFGTAAPTSIAWPILAVNVDNTSATNSLTIQLLTLGVQ